jgi:hypothetical protein
MFLFPVQHAIQPSRVDEEIQEKRRTERKEYHKRKVRRAVSAVSVACCLTATG